MQIWFFSSQPDQQQAILLHGQWHVNVTNGVVLLLVFILLSKF